MVSVYQLKDENRVGEAAKVLSQAFVDDTLTRYVLPDESERLKSAHFFEFLVRLHVRHGEVWAVEDDGRLTAALVMETEPTTDEQAAAAGVMEAMSRIGPEAAERLQHFLSDVEEYRAQHYANPHYHGISVGALPEAQPLGHGVSAIQAAVESAQKAGRHFYGEVLNQPLYDLYTALGFEVAGEFQAADLPVTAVFKRASTSAST